MLEVIARDLSPTTTLGEIVDAAQELGWSEALGEYDLGELALALLGGSTRAADAPVEAANEEMAEQADDDDDDDDATAAPTDTARESPVDAEGEEEGEEDGAEARADAQGEDDQDEDVEDAAEEPPPTKKRSKAQPKKVAARAQAKPEPAKTKAKASAKAKPEPTKAKPEPAKAKAESAKAKPKSKKSKPEPAKSKLEKAKPPAKKVSKKASKKEAVQDLESFFPMLPIFAELDEIVGSAGTSKKASKRAKKAAMYVAPEPVDEGEGMSLEQAAKLLLPLVKRLKEATMQDLETQTGMGRRKLRFHIGQLVKHGRLSRRGMGRGTTYTVIK